MASNNEIEILSQASVYNKKNIEFGRKRKLKLYFSIPEEGINEDTGILLLISGYGANPNSKVYKKMRDVFSDTYNLVTVQCDYFGNEFMQDTNNVEFPLITKDNLFGLFTSEEIEDIYVTGTFDFNKFVRYGSQYDIEINMREDLTKENIDNFNDMGLMQALDNITAVEYIVNIIHSNNNVFNTKKILVYGHSHGAYLGYLCNVIAPNLFSMLIDNSGLLRPAYLFESNRVIVNRVGNLVLNNTYEYNAKKYLDDTEILNLPYIYSNVKNKCRIITYQGADDTLVNRVEKKNFCDSLNNCIYNEINKADIDERIFNSTNHGLAADFIQLFYYTMNTYGKEFEKDKSLDISKEVKITTSKHEYHIYYNNQIPKLVIY